MENNDPKPASHISDVLEKIEKNEIKSRPKTYFEAKFLALVALVFVVFFLSVFLASFILFSFRVSGQAQLIGFGISGWEIFLLLFPWKLFMLEIVLIVGLEWLLRSFKFGYKIPLLYLFLIVLGVMALSGLVLAQTPLHSRLLSEYEAHQLSGPFGSLYQEARGPVVFPHGYGIFRGTVVSVSKDSLVVATGDSDDVAMQTTVTVPSGKNISNIHVGDRIFIAGRMVNGQIQAIKIRVFNAMPQNPAAQ